MKFPDNLYYTENDEWLRVEGEVATMGITDFAQDQLSDIVFVEFVAEEGDTVSKGDTRKRSDHEEAQSAQDHCEDRSFDLFHLFSSSYLIRLSRTPGSRGSFLRVFKLPYKLISPTLIIK